MIADVEVKRYTLINACKQERTVVIRRNEYGRFTWRLIYQDNPAISDREFTYTHNWFDSVRAAKRSAKNFVRRLGQ